MPEPFHLARDPATGIEAIQARFRGPAYDMHAHDAEWLVGVTHQGIQDFWCRGGRRQSTPGRLILIEPGERHDGRAVDEKGFAYSMLYLPVHLLRASFGPDDGFGFRQTLGDDPALGPLLTATCRAILNAAPQLEIETLRDAVLARLRPHLCLAPRRETAAPPGLADRAMELLRADLGADLSTEDLVAAAGASSRFQLNRAFRARFGTTPHACLVELRLARARALLRGPDRLADIAAACGFADQSHLSRWFRRAYGLAPGDWRARTNVQDPGAAADYPGGPQ